MSDVGAWMVDNLYQQLMVDDEWAVRPRSRLHLYQSIRALWAREFLGIETPLADPRCI